MITITNLHLTINVYVDGEQKPPICEQTAANREQPTVLETTNKKRGGAAPKTFLKCERCGQEKAKYLFSNGGGCQPSKYCADCRKLRREGSVAMLAKAVAESPLHQALDQLEASIDHVAEKIESPVPRQHAQNARGGVEPLIIKDEAPISGFKVTKLPMGAGTEISFEPKTVNQRRKAAKR